MSSEVTTASAKVGAAVAGTILGITVTDWAAIATILFVLMQAVVLWPRFWETVKKWVSKHDSSKQGPPQP